jgi:endonuclease YncB( thermonuclease family)
MKQIIEHDAKVIKIVDGDTIHVDLYVTILGRRRTFHDTIIRFKAVDTPERGRTGYYEAKAHTYERLMGKVIQVRGDHTEMNGERWVAIPVVNGEDFTKELIDLQLARQWYLGIRSDEDWPNGIGQ